MALRKAIAILAVLMVLAPFHALAQSVVSWTHTEPVAKLDKGGAFVTVEAIESHLVYVTIAMDKAYPSKDFALSTDNGKTYGQEKAKVVMTHLHWNDATGTLSRDKGLAKLVPIVR